jgi:hypothetical protein
MYSTKTIHKNVGQTYTSIGDPYKASKEALPQRWRDKQFTTQKFPLKNGLFSQLEYHQEPYTELAEEYRKTQPLDKRKLGFGSHDAFKSGEFTSTKATERYRDCVRNEMKLFDRHHQKQMTKENAQKVQGIIKEQNRIPPKDKFGQVLKEPEFLYDIGRTHITMYTPQHSHDSFYKVPRHAPVDPTLKGKDPVRRLGSHKPMSSMIGEHAWTYKYEKPSFGIVSCVEKFCDRGHLEGYDF